MEEEKPKRQPFYFEDYKICIHCASHNVKLIDKFDRVTRNSIYPLSKLRCADCGTEYYIKWIENEAGDLIPVCCDDHDIDIVVNNIIEISNSQRRNL